MVEDEKALAGRLGDVVGEELEDGEHGKAAVLELLGADGLDVLRGLDLLDVSVAAEAEVADLAASGSLVLPADELPVADGGDDLEPAEGGDSTNGADAVGDGGEGGAIKVDGAGKADALLDKVADNSKHGNTAVLELSSAVVVKGGLVDVGGEACWIMKNAKGEKFSLMLTRESNKEEQQQYMTNLPRGSQNPTGGRAPASSVKLILRAEERAMRAAGAKAAAPMMEARMARARNIVAILNNVW